MTLPKQLTYFALQGIPLIRPGANLAEIIHAAIRNNGLFLQDGDVLILAQKIVSKSEGRLVNLTTVQPSPKAIELAEFLGKRPELVELILQESNEIIRTRPGTIIVEHKSGFICANAGIDHSNVKGAWGNDEDWVLLLPEDSDLSAAMIRAELEVLSGARLGVIIIDSHGRAWRNGVLGTTIGASGLPALLDMRGEEDMFHYKLRVTTIATADELAAGGSLMMGQASEGTPVVLARGFPYPLREGNAQELVRKKENDLFPMIPEFVEDNKNLKVTALAGGVGGAKLLVGLDKVLQPGQLTAIVNTGDDFTHFGLHISPDLDSVCYALAGLADPTHGWGRKDESWQVLEELRRIGAPDWFALGDKDLAWHLERRWLLDAGQTLTQVTAHFCELNGIQSRVLPMCDVPAPTLIETTEGEWLGFQDYFVRLKCQPSIAGFALLGNRDVAASDLVIQALQAADLIILAPSNPWVSIDPILALRGVRNILLEKTVVAVSPIVKGSALKGPAAKMFNDLGIEPSALAVRQHYEGILDGFIFDELDSEIAENWPPSAIISESFQTIMKEDTDKVTLAGAVISLGERILQGR